jgi:hypothetical protein
MADPAAPAAKDKIMLRAVCGAKEKRRGRPARLAAVAVGGLFQASLRDFCVM